MSKKETAIKDRIYRLKNGTPLSYTLASRHNPRFPLLWYDEKNNLNRSLRYASNQNSPFEDEQDGNAIMEPIVFEDGLLSVPKTNPALQKFLSYHPQNGVVFEEVDNEKEAHEEVVDLTLEVDALIEAKNLTIDQLELLTRVIFGKDPSTVSTAELRRDILVFAKKEPREFMQIINDPELKYQGKIRMFFENNLLVMRNNNKEVWYNTASNKKKMLSVPYGEEPYDAVGHFLQSDEGIESLKMLESLLK